MVPIPPLCNRTLWLPPGWLPDLCWPTECRGRDFVPALSLPSQGTLPHVQASLLVDEWLCSTEFNQQLSQLSLGTHDRAQLRVVEAPHQPTVSADIWAAQLTYTGSQAETNAYCCKPLMWVVYYTPSLWQQITGTRSQSKRLQAGSLVLESNVLSSILHLTLGLGLLDPDCDGHIILKGRYLL